MNAQSVTLPTSSYFCDKPYTYQQWMDSIFTKDAEPFEDSNLVEHSYYSPIAA